MQIKKVDGIEIIKCTSANNDKIIKINAAKNCFNKDRNVIEDNVKIPFDENFEKNMIKYIGYGRKIKIRRYYDLVIGENTVSFIDKEERDLFINQLLTYDETDKKNYIKVIK